MSDTLDVTTTAAGVRLGLRVVPRASRTAIDGVRAGRLLVRVTAPPVDSAANDAAVAALAAALDLPRRFIRIVTGASGRNKTVEIAGVTEAQVRARLTSDF
jgi:uncharacterized protein YggU (UPF0235/DUF167 family)